MRKIILVLFLLGLATPLFAQVEETLPEVEVLGLHFKYLDAIGDEVDAPAVVKKMHKHVGNFDVLTSDVYDHDIDDYRFTFKIPQGKVLAGYDKEGNLLWTVEKFKDLRLPNNIIKMVAMEYPGWTFDKTFYTIRYNENNGVTKRYKVIISKDGKKKRVTLNPEGDVL